MREPSWQLASQNKRPSLRTAPRSESAIAATLLQVDLATGLFELLLHRFGLGLGDALLHHLGSGVDETLGVGETHLGQFADGLDHANLVGTGLGELDVEGGLLLFRSGCCCTWSCCHHHG